jgi:KAP family P-loop domain
MHKAIERARSQAGIGLWFPCPAEDDTAAFLSALSDNLASEVERRFVRNSFWSLAARRLRSPLTAVAAALIVAAIVTYSISALEVKGGTATTIDARLPVALWGAAGIAVAALFGLLASRIVWDSRPVGRLVREATALRERIRFSTALKRATETGLTGGSWLTSGWKHSDERSLDERPTTAASLVFDFRNLAELIVATIKGPLVIAIDELDKIDDPENALRILRDVKGIFEITNVYFLVSVGEEAASALRLGSLRNGGRNEFSIYFYTVLELPPLSPSQTMDMLKRRQMEVSEPRARLLALLGAGNCREVVRLAEDPPTAARSLPQGDENVLVLGTLEAEAGALLREIITAYADESGADTVITGVWQALPREGFASVEAFSALGRRTIHDFWQPGWADLKWNTEVREPWRRFLIRLFVAATVVALQTGTGAARSFTSVEIADLRDVLIMATRSSSTALLMLKSRFGEDLGHRYTAPAEIRLIPDSAG